MIICLGCMRELNKSSRICPFCGYDSLQEPEKSYFLEPGTILQNRYIVGKAIGNGGFGITYMGYDLTLNRRCAIKEYYPRELSEREKGHINVRIYKGRDEQQFRMGLESFLTEAKRMAEFTNIPQIVEVYDCIRANRTGYIIMEYIPGQTVGQILKKRGRYPYEEARDLIVEVLRGLTFVHRARMIHRDIAPDNIMISQSGQVKLIDFGASRQVIAERSQNYSVILKPGYAPIEQYTTNGHQGPWTDVYAVGATFYRMITGVKPPISLDRQVNDTLQAPSQMGVAIPRYAEQLLFYSLEVNWQYRLQSSEEFLGALIEERTIHIPTPEPPREVLTGTDYLKFITAFIGVMLVTAFIVLFSLELGINGNNILADKGSSHSGNAISGQAASQEAVAVEMETET